MLPGTDDFLRLTTIVAPQALGGFDGQSVRLDARACGDDDNVTPSDMLRV